MDGIGSRPARVTPWSWPPVHEADPLPRRCSARRVQATLALYDAKGRELAYDDDFRLHPDPVLHYVIRRTGNIESRSRTPYTGAAEDFVYRITLGESRL